VKHSAFQGRVWISYTHSLRCAATQYREFLEKETGGMENNMSSVDNLDRNRIKEMVRAYLLGDQARIELLKEMAGKMEEPTHALAAFLVKRIKSVIYKDCIDNILKLEPKVSCTLEQWNFFMKCSREVTKDFDSFVKELKIKAGSQEYKALLGECARIGQWPVRFPQDHRFEEASFISKEWECAWIWFFHQHGEQLIEELRMGYEQSWKPTIFIEGSIVAKGLERAIYHGLVELPDTDFETFLMSYGNWTKGMPKGDLLPHIRTMACTLKFDYEQLSDESLQELSVLFDEFSRDLGKRGVPLKLPRIQNQEAWLDGFAYERRISVPSLEESIKLYKETDDPFVKERLYKCNKSNDLAIDDEDPFGPRVNLFTQAVGETCPTPTYEDALEILSRETVC